MTARSIFVATVLLVCVPLTSTPAAEKRIALVIGNSAYQNVTHLDNPKNDAALMARTLKELGFTLIGDGAMLNLDKAAMDTAVQTFGQQMQGAEVALFYYAGHGVQIRGSNYLVPVNANPTREADVDFQMVDLNLVLRQMGVSGTRLNLVILDACRNNPFGSGGMRGSEPGLAQVRAPEGTLISYATQPGNVAQDGADGDSPYTKALAATIRRPGLDIFRTFNEVGLAVKHATGGEQQPWTSTSPIDGNFYFAGPVIANKETLAGSGAKDTPPATPADPLRLDLVTDCDRLAASPKDPSRPKGIDGIEETKVDIVPALTACRDAMRQYPEVARFPYQAGRIATIQKDQLRARQLYEQAASLGSPAAMNNLAALYDRGDGVAQDRNEARKWFEMAAKGGVTVAMTNLGIIYLRDSGAAADPVEARKWFERAAAAGDPRAMLELGHLHETGRGVPADSAAARKWYGKAADAGMAVGLTETGRIFLNGTGVPADAAEARKWFVRAAAANEPVAMNFLGTIYGRGTGVPRDDVAAHEWFAKSAALGYGLAMHNLGKHYELGIGIPVDLSKARGWYEKCAGLGTANCMTDLAVLYERGSGVPRDGALAREWYEKAAAAGDDTAKTELKKLNSAH
jgi:TPR repeat protein